VASVAALVSESALKEIATDPAVWEGGLELAGTGAVRLIEASPLRVFAEVDDGGGIAEVELTALDDELFWTCTCPDGQEGRPCRHFVAAGRVTSDQSSDAR
jgi:uncharacterized Zn finger protein